MRRSPGVGFLRTLLALLAVLLLSQSCGGASQRELLVFVAASLTNALQELGDRFGQEQGLKVRFNFGASNSLAQQLKRGASADVFIAAGPQPVEEVERAGLAAPGTRKELLTNELVVIVRNDRADVQSLEDVVRGGGKVSIADPAMAPAGWYAREALTNLGLWQQLQLRLVFGSSVRTTLVYVESGNVEAGIVYRTDAAISQRVRVVGTLPSGSYSPIVYPGVVIKGSPRKEAATVFLAFLQSQRAGEVFRRYGFTPMAAP